MYCGERFGRKKILKFNKISENNSEFFVETFISYLLFISSCFLFVANNPEGKFFPIENYPIQHQKAYTIKHPLLLNSLQTPRSTLNRIRQGTVYKLQTIEKLIAYPSVRYQLQNFPNRGTDNRQRLLTLCAGSSR